MGGYNDAVATVSIEPDAPQLSEAKARRLTEEFKADAKALWRKLVYLHDSGAHYALGYRSWADCCETEFGIKSSQAHRLLNAGRVVAVTPQLGNEAQARELFPLLLDEGEEAVIEVY